jgi:hypothetical protein
MYLGSDSSEVVTPERCTHIPAVSLCHPFQKIPFANSIISGHLARRFD